VCVCVSMQFFFIDWALYCFGTYKRQSFARDLFEDLISTKRLPHFVYGSVTLFYRIWLEWCLSTAIVWTAASFWCGEIAECLKWPILCLNSIAVQARPCVCIFNCSPYWATCTEETVNRTYREQVHVFLKSKLFTFFNILNDVKEHLDHESRTRDYFCKLCIY
jgi:hypothetical protein